MCAFVEYIYIYSFVFILKTIGANYTEFFFMFSSFLNRLKHMWLSSNVKDKNDLIIWKLNHFMALDFMNYSFNFIQRSIHLCSILLMLFKAQFSYVEKSPYYKLWQIFSILGRVAIFAHFHEIFVHSCEFLKTALVLISLSLVHLYLWDFCYGDL